MSLVVGTKLGPYEILAPLGAGGMGEVHRARDTRLRREVAIKVVPEAVAQRPQALQRFEREAQTVAALTHVNIVAIYDVGQEQGVHFLVMELLEGETLRQRMAGGALPSRTAVDLALQAARGLAAAHAKGVVHRDLKPDNLFLTRDRLLKILDFGLARLDEAQSDGRAELETVSRRSETEAGTILGTVGYMAPEQARGQRADARADVFALGVVLSEMLTGERAFGGGSTVEVLTSILRDEPRGFRRWQAEAPPALARVVERCLRKAADERFQNAAELVDALEALGATASGSGRELPPVEGPPPPPSIAVLPLAHLSPNADTEYFSDGMTEEIINALAQLPGLKVAARTSSFAFKGKHEDLRDVAHKLGVSTLLEGSVRRSGNRVRVTAQLIDAKDGHHLWSERYDRELADAFAIQDEIAQAIAHRLQGTLLSEPPREPKPRDPEAYDLYMQGRYFFTRRAPSQAIAKFEAAIARDPTLAPAYTGLADSYGIHAFYGGIDSRVAHSHARTAAERARQLCPDSADVNVSLGILEHYFGWDFAREARELDEATRRSPGSATPLYWRSLLHGLRGELDLALPLARSCAALEPLSPFPLNAAGIALFTARRYREARAEFQRGLELDPNSVLLLNTLARCDDRLGNSEAALKASEKAVSLTERRSSFALGGLAWTHAAASRIADARRVLAELDERAKAEYVAPLHVAPVLFALGDKDAAFAAFERACAERNALAWFWVLHAPGLEPMRQDPRFPALAARVEAFKG